MKYLRSIHSEVESLSTGRQLKIIVLKKLNISIAQCSAYNVEKF